MEKLLLYNKQDEFIDISRVYFNISNIYAGLINWIVRCIMHKWQLV